MLQATDMFLSKMGARRNMKRAGQEKASLEQSLGLSSWLCGHESRVAETAAFITVSSLCEEVWPYN